jgi:hypothetical protein
MDVISSFTYIDPSLENLDFLDVNGNFNVTYGDELGTLTPNTNLDQILDTDQIPRTVCRDPSDGVWNTRDQEENLRLLHRNSIFADFPFPPVVISSTDAKMASGQALPADSCLPPPKRRSRKRKARLSEAEKEEKHQRFLERNRLAASKCRAKKKDELERLEARKKELERENRVLRRVLRDLWDEVRLYRDAIMTHASCKHPDIVECTERNAEFSAAMDTLCQSLFGEELGRGRLDGGGSPNSRADDSPKTSTSSEDRGSGCSSISSFTSSPPSPAST